MNKKDLAFDDFTLLEKADCTLQESLSIYSLAPFIPRYSLKGFEFASHKIPANNTIMRFELLSDYLPKRPTNPDTFDPYVFHQNALKEKMAPIKMGLLAAAFTNILVYTLSKHKAKCSWITCLKNIRLRRNQK